MQKFNVQSETDRKPFSLKAS